MNYISVQRMRKEAAILTELQPHQQAALDRGKDNNLVLAHSTGSGKTLTAIALANELGLPTTVLTPASLVANFQKELKKHKRGGPSVNVMSLPTAVQRNIPIPKGNTLIIDEAHALRNLGTARQKYIKGQLDNAGRVFTLTGTPNYNNIADIAQLVNISAKDNVLPNDPGDFKERFVETTTIKPGFIDRVFYGVKPGKIDNLKNTDELRRLIAPHVDVFDTDIDKPERIDEHIRVPMSAEQVRMYRAVERNMPSYMRRKLQKNIPPNKTEAKMLNAFYSGVRQISNSTRSFDTEGEPGTKIRQAAAELAARMKENPKLRALVYSNYLESGVDSYASLMDEHKIPYAKFTGSLTPKHKKQIVEDYNSGKVPVILGSGSASEGLDLKNTRLIQLLEPHFNQPKLDQVIGRGIRYKSHEELPKDQRNVTVQHYYSTFPKGNDTAVDEYLASRAAEKAALVSQLKNLFNKRT